MIKWSVVCVLVVVGIGAWFWYDLQNFAIKPVNVATDGAVFEVPAGSHFGLVAQSLEDQGIISSAQKLRWWARINKQDRLLKAGEYDIPSGTTVEQLLQIFSSGKVRQYGLTIIEGWTFSQLRKAIAEHPKLKQTTSQMDAADLIKKLGLQSDHLEGWFLPDTYYFPAGMSDIAFLDRALKAMQKTMEAAWQEREPDLPLASAYEALILASIVEKETAVVSERTEIAGVFINRLNKKMRLQTDPTVIYGLGEDYSGNLKRSHLRSDTPYNTYTRHGLPPTPIALPSAAAIRAVLKPNKTEALYFVAKGDGSHQFSKTLAEHNKAVREFQIVKRKKNYRSTPQVKANE